MIDYTIKSEKLGEITVHEAREHEQFVNTLNYLIQEGFVELEEGTDGEIRLYPA